MIFLSGEHPDQRVIQYIPWNMHTVFVLLCFVVVIHWLIFPYPSSLLHWHCGNLTIAPVPAKQPWWIWINTSCEFIMNDCITTTKQSTTKPCAYFLGYTVVHTLAVRHPRHAGHSASPAFCRRLGPFIQQSLSQITQIMRMFSILLTAGLNWPQTCCSRENSMVASPGCWRTAMTAVVILGDGFVAVRFGASRYLGIPVVWNPTQTVSEVDARVVESHSAPLVTFHLWDRVPIPALPCWWVIEGPSIAWGTLPGRYLYFTIVHKHSYCP